MHDISTNYNVYISWIQDSTHKSIMTIMTSLGIWLHTHTFLHTHHTNIHFSPPKSHSAHLRYCTISFGAPGTAYLCYSLAVYIIKCLHSFLFALECLTISVIRWLLTYSTYTHTHKHTCTHTQTYKYTYIHTHTNIHAHTQKYTHTNIRAHTQVHIYSYIHTYIHAYTHKHTYIHAYTHIHTYIHTYLYVYAY